MVGNHGLHQIPSGPFPCRPQSNFFCPCVKISLHLVQIVYGRNVDFCNFVSYNVCALNFTHFNMKGHKVR